MFYSFGEKGEREFVPLLVSQGDENFYALSYFLQDVIPKKFMIDDLAEKRCMQMIANDKILCD